MGLAEALGIHRTHTQRSPARTFHRCRTHSYTDVAGENVATPTHAACRGDGREYLMSDVKEKKDMARAPWSLHIPRMRISRTSHRIRHFLNHNRSCTMALTRRRFRGAWDEPKVACAQRVQQKPVAREEVLGA